MGNSTYGWTRLSTIGFAVHIGHDGQEGVTTISRCGPGIYLYSIDACRIQDVRPTRTIRMFGMCQLCWVMKRQTIRPAGQD